MADQGVFAQSSLEANRAGRLTDDQRRALRGSSRGVRKLELQFAVVSTIIALIILFGLNPAKTNAWMPLVGIGLLILAGFLLVRAFLGADATTRDLRRGYVDSVDGPIAKQVVHSDTEGSSSSSYYFHVAGQRVHVSYAQYEAAPDGGLVKIYFLPASKRLVNMERLGDVPVSPDMLRSPEMLRQAVKGIVSSNWEDRAEARANIAAAGNLVKGSIQKEVVAPAASARDTRPLAEAIVGSWSNAIVSATFSADGTFAVTMPGGQNRTGHWSVDSSGKLVADLMGRAAPTDAWVAGDELTVSMGGQGITLQRATTSS